jgi:adenylate cyclase
VQTDSGGCPDGDVSSQLSRILDTPVFRRSPSLGRFLRYLVERRLAGEYDSVKEHRLALEVFDRRDDFDPRNDTIVRVQARNLRARLDDYYENSDAADTVRFVLPKGAYSVQFEPIATVQPAAIPEPAALPRAPRSRRKIAIAAVAVLSAAAIGAFFALRHFSTNAPGGTTLVVAPFANLSADQDNEYFAGGLTEELTDALANLPGLRVVARTSSLRWTGREIDLVNLRKLGIDNVVEGSVRKEGPSVRISVRLIDASNARQLWSHEYDREIQDSILTEQEIARAVATTLKLKLEPGTAPLAIRPPAPEAYDLYLKGLYSWHQYDPASAAKGIAYLEKSLSIDGSFAPAYIALAGCYGTQLIYYRLPSAVAYAQMREVLITALQLDENAAEAHTLLGGVYAWNDWNWKRAEFEYREAVRLAPQSVIAHQYYASFLGALGRKSEAEPQMRQAMRLDPLDTLVQWGEAQLMFWRGENRAAEAALNAIAKQDPDFGLTAQLLAEVEWSLGKDKEAEAVLRAHLARRPDDPLPLGELGYALAKSGRTREARDILKQLQEDAPGSVIPRQALAFVYLGLGENDQAIEELWKAADLRTIRVPWLNVEPVYAPLRRHARWADLLRHVNLQ